MVGTQRWAGENRVLTVIMTHRVLHDCSTDYVCASLRMSTEGTRAVQAAVAMPVSSHCNCKPVLGIDFGT